MRCPDPADVNRAQFSVLLVVGDMSSGYERPGVRRRGGHSASGVGLDSRWNRIGHGVVGRVPSTNLEGSGVSGFLVAPARFTPSTNLVFYYIITSGLALLLSLLFSDRPSACHLYLDTFTLSFVCNPCLGPP